jgi:DNA-binding response OmpR family regulator
VTKRILIVDDEPKVGISLKESLEALRQDYAVSHVLSAEAALSALAAAPIDLVVTDLRMPGLSGLDLLTRVQRDQPQRPTILIIAYGSDDVAAARRRLQTSRYLTRPFHIDEFVRAVQEVLAQLPAEQPPGTPLTDKKLERMTQRLQDLRFEAQAGSVLLADAAGQLLVEIGATEGIEAADLARPLRSCFEAPAAIAQQWHKERPFNLLYHEGVRFDLCASNVSANLFVVMVFDRRQGPTRIGVVWLYLKRAILDLQNVLQRADDSVLPAGGWPPAQ